MMAAVIAAMALGELLGSGSGPHAAIEVTDLVIDSRQVRPGAAFVAVAGSAGHGLAHAGDALDRGAAVVLYEPAPGVFDAPHPGVAVPGLRGRSGELAGRFFWRRLRQPALYGVTGTNGKTTVAWLVAQALTALGRDCAYVGTLGYGRTGALEPHALTTPDCFTLHRELAGLDVDSAMLEVSSHGLAQDRVAGLRFAVAAVTNLSRDHLDAHGSMAAYARTKSRIVHLPGLRAVALNLDDPFAAGLRPEVPAAVRTIGVSAHGAAAADVSANVTLRGLDGIELGLSADRYAGTLSSALIGDFNAENLLVALGILVGAGVELPDAAAALADCRAAPGRMEVLGGGAKPYVVVDYAHTPAALERSLAVVGGLGGGALTCVFGCGGDRDAGKRELMGRAACTADRIVLTDDNPRSEDPRAIVADIRRGIDAWREVLVEHDRAHAIHAAVAAARPGDIVLIAGKGHETTQSIGGVTVPLDDRTVALDALDALDALGSAS